MDVVRLPAIPLDVCCGISPPTFYWRPSQPLRRLVSSFLRRKSTPFPCACMCLQVPRPYRRETNDLRRSIIYHRGSCIIQKPGSERIQQSTIV